MCGQFGTQCSLQNGSGKPLQQTLFAQNIFGLLVIVQQLI
jgi:hypothetical protein